MGHFKGTVKVHGAHNVTYKTFRKNSTQASCLLDLSQKIQYESGFFLFFVAYITFKQKVKGKQRSGAGAIKTN